jgi:putative endonuclease
MRPELFIFGSPFQWDLRASNGPTGATAFRGGQQASEGAVIPPGVAAFVYLLRCADGTLYCGWSTDPERRLRQHQAGTASRYTRTRRPVELVYRREFATRSEAMREEARIKRLPPAEKRRLSDTTANV